jgi:L-alanine-DL-glutamate epimerase-like enolase superfamily enzyme
MRISAVRCFEVQGPAEIPAQEERQVGMLDIYPHFASRPPAGPRDHQTGVYVQVEEAGGAYGLFGPIFPETVPLIQNKLAPMITGQDPRAGEYLWDVMYRSDRHARKGYLMMAISAVDCALWDLRGKLAGEPVWRLLGGPTRPTVPCYASMLGYSHEPARIVARVREMVDAGYRAQKWFFRYGPNDGLVGMERNVTLARIVREAAGPNIDLMFDCWMGWDLSYATRMIERLEPFRPRWLEEAVPADRIAEFAQMRDAGRVPIATGEHEYTRWGFLQLLQTGGVDVLQADPDWCGGISELVKIGTLASAYGRHVIPHGHSVYAAAHVVASQPPVTFPMAEYLVRYQPMAQHFHTYMLVPEGGAITLPTLPGLGIEIDPAKVTSRRDL